MANAALFKGLSGSKYVSDENYFSLRQVSVKDVKCIIDSLPHNTVVGQNQILVTMLKKSPIAVFEALAFTFIESLSTGIFPEVWKSAIIVPVHKKGDIYYLDNYRPISYLSTASKVFERLVNIQLRDYMESFNILNDAQHGFRAGCSCESALLQLTKRLFSLKIRKQFVYMLAIDFSRAFDTLNHCTLLKRLSLIANDSTSAWFRSFLLDRRQYTKHCDTIFDPRYVVSGNPQGSVLGTSIFLLYINGLLDSLTPDYTIAYADNITIVCHSSTPSEVTTNAEKTVVLIAGWSRCNGLVLNAQKASLYSSHLMLRKKFLTCHC